MNLYTSLDKNRWNVEKGAAWYFEHISTEQVKYVEQPDGLYIEDETGFLTKIGEIVDETFPFVTDLGNGFQVKENDSNFEIFCDELYRGSLVTVYKRRDDFWGRPDSQVNWSAIGSCTPKMSRLMAECLQIAANVAEQYDAENPRSTKNE